MPGKKRSGTKSHLIYSIRSNNGAYETALVLIVQCATILTIFCTAPCLSQSTWEWRNPLPQGNVLRSIVFGADRFVAVGDRGSICASSNGMDWSLSRPPASETLATCALYGVSYAGGLYFAVGELGTILTSKDAATWQKQSSGYNNVLQCVAFGNNTFVAVGGAILSSPDGVKWTKQVDATYLGLKSVVFANNRFIAVGDSGLIMNSSNGQAWSMSTIDSRFSFSQVIYANNQFVGVGSKGAIFTSPDAVDWKAENSLRNYNLTSIVFDNGQYVVTGEAPTILTSADAKNWTIKEPKTTRRLCSIAFGHNTFVAVGEYGTILVSPSGTDWSLNIKGDTNNFVSIVYGNGKYVAIDYRGNCAISSDAMEWSLGNCPVSSPTSIAFGNNVFVVSGSNAAYSSDGQSWTLNTSISTLEFDHVAFCNDRFILIGWEGTVYSSFDGQKWTAGGKIYDFPTIYGMAYGKNTYVAVGRDGIFTSTNNGSSWTPRPAPTGFDIQCVAFGKGTFVAFDWADRVLISSDGSSWDMKYLYMGDIGTPQSMIYADSQFVTAGGGGEILTSIDGIAWKRANGCSRQALTSVTYGGAGFVAAGYNGSIIASKADPVSKVRKANTSAPPAGNLKITVEKCFITVKLSKAATPKKYLRVQIFDITGRRRCNTDIVSENGYAIIPSSLPSGYYYMSIFENGESALNSAFIVNRQQ